jgi:hypothetical protein
MSAHNWSASLRALLFDPDRFFENRTPRTGVAGLVVTVVAVLHAVLLVAIVGLSVVQLSLLQSEVGLGELLGESAGAVVGEAVVLLVSVFLNWLLVSALLHVVVKLLDGRGRFGATLYVVGWSSPVALLTMLVGGASILLAFQGLDPGGTIEPQLQRVSGVVGGAGALGSLLVLLWQGYIWPAGLERTHEMARDKAVQATGVTVFLGIVATLLTL